MSREKLVGVDIGTQGTKAALFSVDGSCLAEEFVPSRLIRNGSGVVREDPEEQVASVGVAVSRCVERSGVQHGEIAALAIDGQMAGILGVGNDGINVTPYDSWLDTQCAPQIREMSEAAGLEVLRSTGGIPSFNHGPKILWWKRRHLEIYRRVASFVQPAAYAAMRLCGKRAAAAFIDHTYLHFSGFADNPGGRWNLSLCERFDVDATKLPRIVAPTEIVGRIDDRGSRLLGLAAGTPIAAGCGDTAASFLACGATEAGICVDVAGTASVFAGTTSEFRVDEEERAIACSRSACPGLWHPYAYINGGGMNLEWFRSLLRGAQRDRNPEGHTGPAEESHLNEGPSDAPLSLETLDDEASGISLRRDDPFFVPHLGGRVMPSAPYLRGAWIGLDWSHRRGHLYRAILESVALEYGLYLATIRRLYPSLAFSVLHTTGGGSESRLWKQMKAAVCNMPVAGIVESRGGPSGAAMVAGVAAGVFGTLSEASAAWVRRGEAVAPEVEQSGHYTERLSKYRALLELLTEFSGPSGGENRS